MEDEFDLGVHAAVLAAKHGMLYHNGEICLEPLETFDFCDLRVTVKLSFSLSRYTGEIEHDEDTFTTGLIKKQNNQYVRAISWRRSNGEGIPDNNVRAEILDLYTKEYLHRGNLVEPKHYGLINPGTILVDREIPMARINTPSIWTRLQKWINRK